MHKTTERYNRIAVFGAGVSGRSAQSLAISLGLQVSLFDETGQGNASELDPAVLAEFDAFIFSPGFAATHPWRILAESSSKPCFSELGFAASHWRGRLIGVTGTNGKTTLTSLLTKALKTAGISAVEAGNIGIPLSDWVLSKANQKTTEAVCEISSFQAELTRGLKLDGLVWTNFAEDHQDRHTSLEEYFVAKLNLIKCLQPEAPAFLGTSVEAFDTSVRAAPNHFVIGDHSEWIERLAPESPFQSYPQSVNFALATAFWQYFNLPAESLISSANAFQLAAHRLSRVSEWGGVSFWNDSKATNFHAALAAMDALEGTIYWIGGGSYKGGNLRMFVSKAASKVKKAFLYGAVAEEMSNHFREEKSDFEQHADFTDAVQAAAEGALQDAPSVVLLSPGFASFDQFPNYSARGNSFKATILKLKDNYCPD